MHTRESCAFKKGSLSGCELLKLFIHVHIDEKHTAKLPAVHIIRVCFSFFVSLTSYFNIKERQMHVFSIARKVF
jgi:hypothetical protein